jgi:hypothetical protein
MKFVVKLREGWDFWELWFMFIVLWFFLGIIGIPFSDFSTKPFGLSMLTAIAFALFGSQLALTAIFGMLYVIVAGFLSVFDIRIERDKE